MLSTNEKPSPAHHDTNQRQGLVRKISATFNKCSLRARKNSLYSPITLSPNFDFIRITETCHNKHTPDNTIVISGYKAFKKSRKTQRAGGCFVHTRESMPATLCQDTKLKSIQDALWVRAAVGEGKPPVQFVYCSLFLTKISF